MIRWMIAAALIAALAAGCGKKPASPENSNRRRITLQLNWKPEPQFGGFYAAQVEGIYEKRGLDVAITPGGAGAPTVEMLGAGTVPFAIVSGDEIIRARAKGNPVVALFAVYQTSPQGIMTRAARGLQSLADLFRRKGILAIERGLPYSDFLERKYGFDKLKIVPSPFGDLTLYRTLEDYAMQCFVTSEPLAAKATGIEPQTFLVAESGYNPYTTVLATSEKYLRDHPAVVRAMIESAEAGWRSYLSDPASANLEMSKLNPTMDPQTFKASALAQKPLIETVEARQRGLGVMTLDRWETLVRQLVELEVIDRPIAADRIFFRPGSPE